MPKGHDAKNYDDPVERPGVFYWNGVHVMEVKMNCKDSELTLPIRCLTGRKLQTYLLLI
jgi:hypothetical protein